MTAVAICLESGAVPMDLFAGIPVSDYAAAVEWYGRLFGSPPTFLPNDNEAVWELAEHRSEQQGTPRGVPPASSGSATS